MSEVARDCAIERKVAENYFSILEDLLLAQRLPVFTKRAKRRMVAHPKFYFFDVGVFRTLRPMGPLDRPEEAEGAAYESLFYQELRAINAYGDFEIKRSRKVDSKDLRGLKSFLTDYPMAKAYCVLEPSAWAATYARAKTGAEVLQGGCESANFAPGSFDIVTVWDVIEHFEDPALSLSKISRWLRKDGMIVVSTHNIRSLFARLLTWVICS